MAASEKQKKAERSFQEKLAIPQGITVAVAGVDVTISSAGKKTVRKFLYPQVRVSVEGDQIIISADNNTRRELKVVGTFKAQLKTMFKGVTKGHVYKMKICSGHFPMNASVSGKEFIIKNFLGESLPRKASIPPEVKVTVQGTDIVIESPNKELAGQTAASIEQITKIKKRDSRVFQDGIYIIEKDGKAA